MTSIGFPKMFNGDTTNLTYDKEAIMSNLKLLLKSFKNSLFGDPYYGTNLLNMIYEQNNVLLVDIIKDEIYTDITEFIPQLSVTRDNIVLQQDGTHLVVSILATNKLNGMSDLYNINLIDYDETT